MVFFLLRPLSVWSVVLHQSTPASQGGWREESTEGTAMKLPPDGSGRVRTAEQRPWAELKNDLNQTLSAQRARRQSRLSGSLGNFWNRERSEEFGVGRPRWEDGSRISGQPQTGEERRWNEIHKGASLGESKSWRLTRCNPEGHQVLRDRC